MSQDGPPFLTKAQMKSRAKSVAKIKENRRQFKDKFPDLPCRVQFNRPPTLENPTIRVGTGTILQVIEQGRNTRIFYKLDDDKPNLRREVSITTFLNDEPMSIEK